MRLASLAKVLAGVCFGLGVLNWTLVHGEQAPLEIETSKLHGWKPPLTALAPLTPEPAVELARLSQTRERPLFSQSRRPPVETVSSLGSEQAAPLESPPSFELKGVLFAAGHRKALIATPENPDGQWIGLGSAIGAWSLDVITYEGATVRRGDRSSFLELYKHTEQIKKSRPDP